jgi:NAD(P)-dependent dehydrogenase (short-subunit alcohol dehydrogenase family)
MGYSVTKAAGLHLMKHFAFCLGPKIRVNAVLPGLLLTEWVRIFLSNAYDLGPQLTPRKGKPVWRDSDQQYEGEGCTEARGKLSSSSHSCH